MNFKLYDILSLLIPGFLLLLVGFKFFDIKFDSNLSIAYTAVAFFLGFLIDAISSWLEFFYFFSWGGKPSTKLLDGKYIRKVRFYQHEKVKGLLKKETSSPYPTNDELFSIAMRNINQKDNRIEDFNSSYAFSRSILTCVIICGLFIIIQNHTDCRYYLGTIPVILIVWLRCKERSYYFAREVLNLYLKTKG